MTSIFMIILIACLMLMDFFGANITDDYVEGNFEYSSTYKSVLNQNINNGYVSLSRILYFYLEDETKKFNEIYNDNLDLDNKQILPISEVCLKEKYINMDVCKLNNYENSGQINDYQNKPFYPPINFSKTTITSFFMEERIIYGNEDIHKAWDFASKNKTPVYSVCDGEVIKSNFKYEENIIDKTGGTGNTIVIKCEIDDEITYEVLYGHLYPNTNKVKKGDIVKKGTIIAGVGTTGYSTGPHLHFQVKDINNKYIDGMSLIDFNTSYYDINIEDKYNSLK